MLRKTTRSNAALSLILLIHSCLFTGGCFVQATAAELDNGISVPICAGSCVYELPEATVDKEKGNKPLPFPVQVLIVEICAAGYGYWSAESTGSYVAVSALGSTLFGMDYMGSRRSDSLMPALMFGAMAVRGAMIDNQKMSKREIEKTTFIDINLILLTLGLAEGYITRDKGERKSNFSISYIPKSGGGAVKFFHQF